MPDTFRVTIGSRTHTVELDEQEAGDGKTKLRAVVDGVEHLLDARRLSPGAWSLIEEGEARLVEVDGNAPKLSVEVSHPDGEPRQAAVEVARAGGDAAAPERAQSGPLGIRAPIPG